MSKYNFTIPPNVQPRPTQDEINVAIILLKHFKQNIRFIPRQTCHTPDLEIGNIRWEIKSPTGSGKRNVQHQIHRALKQSKNIIFDARNSKLRITKIRGDLIRYAAENQNIKRLILIEKDEKVVVIK